MNNSAHRIFIRRFLHSELLKRLDTNNPSLLSLDVNEGINSISEQFGETDYGEIKFSPGALFWIGYMYRYWHLYTGFGSTKIIRMTPVDTMKRNYTMFHTMDPVVALRILRRYMGRTVIRIILIYIYTSWVMKFIDPQKTPVTSKKLIFARFITLRA